MIEVEVIGGVGVTALCERGTVVEVIGGRRRAGPPGMAVIEVEVIDVRFFHFYVHAACEPSHV